MNINKHLEKPKGARFTDQQFEYILALLDNDYTFYGIGKIIGASPQGLARSVSLYEARNQTIKGKPKPICKFTDDYDTYKHESASNDGGPWYEQRQQTKTG